MGKYIAFSELALLSINHLFEHCLSFSHVSRILSGISFLQRWLNEVSISSLFQVKQVMKGYQRNDCFSDGRRPITFPILQTLIVACDMLCMSVFEA